jgi:hypothetical protein
MKNESTSQQTGNIRRFHLFLFLVLGHTLATRLHAAMHAAPNMQHETAMTRPPTIRIHHKMDGRRECFGADEFDGAPPPRSVRRVLLGLQRKLRGLGHLTDMRISQSC